MTFEPISKLFSSRDIRVDGSDVQHALESYLHEELRSEKIHCRILGAAFHATVRVASPAVAEAILIRESGIRKYLRQHLGCSLGDLRVMIDG